MNNLYFFLLNHTAPTEIYTLSLHDALPIFTDVNGPRLTGSPGFKSAAEWAARQMKEFGLENSRLEPWGPNSRSEEHTSELQSRENLVCRLLLEKKKKKINNRCVNNSNKSKY